MNVNPNRTPKPSRMEEAPRPRERFRSPAELLAVLAPGDGAPAPIRHSGLWKMGPEPQGA